MNNDIPEIVMRVLQGNQTEEEMHIFLQWYRASPENKDLFFRLKHIYELRKGGLNPDEIEMEASWDRLREKINMHPSLQAKVRSNRYIRIVRYASAAAIAILLIVAGIRVFHKDHQPVTWVEVCTGTHNEPQIIQLSDGSSVQLNASSRFRYPEKFNTKAREVYLDGEAYFTVAKHEGHSFVVHTDKQQVSVLGTEFNVLAYSSDPYTITTLVKGKVKLQTFDSESNLRNEVMMHPRQQVYFDKKVNETAVSVIDPTEATSWLKGVYSFKDTSLEEITRRLEKVYGVIIVIPDETYRNEKYTGKFFSYQTIAEIVDILNFKGEFRSKFSNDTIFLQKK